MKLVDLLNPVHIFFQQHLSSHEEFVFSKKHKGGPVHFLGRPVAWQDVVVHSISRGDDKLLRDYGAFRKIVVNFMLNMTIQRLDLSLIHI